MRYNAYFLPAVDHFFSRGQKLVKTRKVTFLLGFTLNFQSFLKIIRDWNDNEINCASYDTD